MALSLTRDITAEMNEVGYYVADSSNWDYIIWHLIGIEGGFEATFLSSNDSGAIHGVTDGNSLSATNFAATVFTKLSDGTLVTTTAADGLYRSSHDGQFVKVDSGSTGRFQKAIIRLHKIS
jgi:hypothetical protein